MNRAMLIGNVGQDPDIRTTQSGSKIAAFSLATNESWTDKRSGERVERTEWHRIVVFNEALAELVEKFVSKGDKLYAEGTLRTREWEDSEGIRRYTTEIALGAFDGRIVLLGSRNGNSRATASGNDTEAASAGKASADDAIPF
ncbi:MAG: single-stranded DNA-binding protein [Acetobacteraceae bacterium]